MKKRVKFSFESNVISCGVRLKPNFLKSVDVISGAVLRAAFANDILLECPFAEEVVDEKKFQVVSRGEKCGNCKNKNICEKFSGMNFSFMYPENSVPAPFTARTCKGYGTAHSVMDTVMQNGRLICPVCKGRMESLKGLVNKTDYKSVRVPHSSSTHTAIDPNTRTALDGSLFSIDAIKRGMVYECEIDDCDTGMLYEGKVIYLGKYSSAGFGKIKIISVEVAEESSVKNRIDRFNEKFGGSDRKYASVLFLSGAKLDIDKYADEIRTTEEYRSIWKEVIFGKDSLIDVEQVIAQNYIYNGFDTSVDGEDRQRKSEFLTEKGTSVRVSFPAGSGAEDLLEQLEKNGIGRDTECGYGRIAVCSDIHMLGIQEQEG